MSTTAISASLETTSTMDGMTEEEVCLHIGQTVLEYGASRLAVRELSEKVLAAYHQFEDIACYLRRLLECGEARVIEFEILQRDLPTLSAVELIVSGLQKELTRHRALIGALKDCGVIVADGL